ncbi:hypothetical protein [uncultured Paludibaculum sp.]|uniref:hypothetical protein n=1 Tax=uncultured Paludibaculum sp. TaxID=1765020 RepID=UPI002AAAAEF5|nr:hypothetical protein [uncultured Paludibaculum sp.]
MRIHAVRMGVLLACAAGCFGQALIEHAAAAGVGTAGSAGGKMISNGLDKIFGKVAAATKEAEGKPAPEAKAKVKTPAGAKATSAAMGSSATAPSRRSRVQRRERDTVEASETVSRAMPVRSYHAAPPRVVATSQEFAKLTAGAPKHEVTERLGAPSYKIVIPDEGHLVEIYRYSSRGADLGRVRVVDGTVTEVKAAQP